MVSGANYNRCTVGSNYTVTSKAVAYMMPSPAVKPMMLGHVCMPAPRRHAGESSIRLEFE